MFGTSVPSVGMGLPKPGMSVLLLGKGLPSARALLQELGTGLPSVGESVWYLRRTFLPVGKDLPIKKSRMREIRTLGSMSGGGKRSHG